MIWATLFYHVVLPTWCLLPRLVAQIPIGQWQPRGQGIHFDESRRPYCFVPLDRAIHPSPDSFLDPLTKASRRCWPAVPGALLVYLVGVDVTSWREAR